MTSPEGALIHHISRATVDVKRLAGFYQEVLGFQRLDTPVFQGVEVIWLQLPGSPIALHLIERDPRSMLPEGPHGKPGEAVVADPRGLTRGHHICFAVSNYDEFVRSLKERGVETFENTQPDGKTKQVFFFDPDVFRSLWSFTLAERSYQGKRWEKCGFKVV